MTGTVTLTALMACHNRRSSTVAALNALFIQKSRARVKAILVDDGSTDGTSEAVAALPWDVHVLHADGSLYWASAMALAERTAMVDKPDYLLWLNDDTIVDPDCLTTLLSVSQDYDDRAIVVGATRDPETGAVTYGGRFRSSRWHPQRLALLPLAAEPQSADTFNGNLVLIPRPVRQRVGPIDGAFPHAYADDDYGLRARSAGIPVIQAPGSLALCRRVDPGVVAPGWRDRQQPKGLPLRAQARFLRRHGGPAWPLILLAQQAKWVWEARGGH